MIMRKWQRHRIEKRFIVGLIIAAAASVFLVVYGAIVVTVAIARAITNENKISELESKAEEICKVIHDSVTDIKRLNEGLLALGDTVSLIHWYIRQKNQLNLSVLTHCDRFSIVKLIYAFMTD